MPKKEMNIKGRKADSQKNVEYVFRLFVTGVSPNSVKAITNLKEICETYLANRYSLEIIDVYQQPTLAKEEQIVALPLLIIKCPAPAQRLIGDLSDTAKILKRLGL